MSFTLILEIVCFFTALLCLFKAKDNAWRGMIIYLFIVCLAEITGRQIRIAHHHNAWVYNISLIAEALFNSLLFGSILKQYFKSKALILSGLALIFLVYIFDTISHGFLIFNDHTTTLMSVVFVIYSFYYYFLLIRDEHYTDLKQNASFWWITGSLFFYFGSTASNLFYGFLSGITLGSHNVTYTVNMALSILLYGCWIYSFICKRWQQTRSGT